MSISNLSLGLDISIYGKGLFERLFISTISWFSKGLVPENLGLVLLCCRSCLVGVDHSADILQVGSNYYLGCNGCSVNSNLLKSLGCVDLHNSRKNHSHSRFLDQDLYIDLYEALQTRNGVCCLAGNCRYRVVEIVAKGF